MFLKRKVQKMACKLQVMMMSLSKQCRRHESIYGLDYTKSITWLQKLKCVLAFQHKKISVSCRTLKTVLCDIIFGYNDVISNSFAN